MLIDFLKNIERSVQRQSNVILTINDSQFILTEMPDGSLQLRKNMINGGLNSLNFSVINNDSILIK